MSAALPVSAWNLIESKVSSTHVSAAPNRMNVIVSASPSITYALGPGGSIGSVILTSSFNFDSSVTPSNPVGSVVLPPLASSYFQL
jgi:hypothetical protein